MLGGISGCVAGLVAITPASGFVQPFPAILVRIHSATSQLSAAAAAAKCVATKALVASEDAASALPALNPNHPTHSMQAPTVLNTMLCGRIGSVPYPFRL